MNNKVIVKIHGGLGNQLFCYAAARRLAWANDAELVLDHVSGFACDFKYKRKFELDCFNVAGRLAKPEERFEPLAGIRRTICRRWSRLVTYEKRVYIEERGLGFDERMLSRTFIGSVYLDGYWQSYKYFDDVADLIRSECRAKTAIASTPNQKFAAEMHEVNSVALHVRWFQSAGGATGDSNLGTEYYINAIKYIESRVENPRYFIFSDDPQSAVSCLSLPEARYEIVRHNNGSDAAIADHWLMTHCKHFITANSTYSWWGAWLGSHPDKIVVAPNFDKTGVGAWGFPGLIPDDWVLLN